MAKIYNFTGTSVARGDFVYPEGGPYYAPDDVSPHEAVVLTTTGEAVVEVGPNMREYYVEGFLAGLSLVGALLVISVLRWARVAWGAE